MIRADIQDDAPDFIKHMWETAPKHPDGVRKRRRDILHNMYERVGNGWIVNTNKPFFEEAKKQISRKFSQDKQQGKPAEVWAEEFRGGWLSVCLTVLGIVLQC